MMTHYVKVDGDIICIGTFSACVAAAQDHALLSGSVAQVRMTKGDHIVQEYFWRQGKVVCER